MQTGGKKFEKTERTKFRKKVESYGEGQKLKDFKKKHNDKIAYRLLKQERNQEFDWMLF